MSVAVETSRSIHVGTVEWHLCGVIHEGERVRELAIAEPRCRVGRQPSCELHVTWSTVSGLHAEFLVAADALFLRDLDSTNGTFVNGHRIHCDTPLHDGDVIHFGGVEFCVRRSVCSDEFGTVQWDAARFASRLMGFDQLVGGEELIPFYQPIVALEDESTIAYEVLARSTHPEFPSPLEMFETAGQLDREQDLSESCRFAGVTCGQDLPGGERLFLNTHPAELKCDGLVESLRTLRHRVPGQRLSLEIHEQAVTDLKAMTELQARLLDLVDVPPDVLKFDISLVRDIHKASSKHQKMVGTLVEMVRDFGITPLAEGIESQAEADACTDLGFEYAQGFHFGRPAPASGWRMDSTWQALPL